MVVTEVSLFGVAAATNPTVYQECGLPYACHKQKVVKELPQT